MHNHKHHLIQDLAIIASSVALAIILVKIQAVPDLIKSMASFKIIGGLVAGMFFTSMFTVAPAAVTLAEIARTNSLALTAFLGGLGAVAGDLLIFLFIKDRFSTDLMSLMKEGGLLAKFNAVFKSRLFRWLTWLLGALIIASPLPDELGVSLLGLSKMKTPLFVLISFTFNSFGIFLIGLAAKILL